MFPQENLNTSPDSDAVETAAIDLNAEIVADDPEADFNERNAPPPAGVYPIKWQLGDKGVVPAQDKNGKPYVAVYLKGELQAESPFENYPVTYYMNSIIFGSKGTSEVHHFMNCIGEPLPNRITLGEMKERIENALANSPVGNALCDWKGSYQSGVNQQTGKAVWTDQYKSMKAFPIITDPNDPTKKIRSFIGKSPKDGENIFAQFVVKQHLSQSEAKKLAVGS